MTHAFTPTDKDALVRADSNTRRTVLVTGAAGRIGSYFAEHSHQKYTLRLMIQEGQDTSLIRSFGEVVTGDLLDLDRMKTLCQGIDTVVHMAGDPDPSATWKDLLDANIIGTYHTMVAAKAAGCRRLIYASSIHAVSGYPADVQVKTSEPVNPGDLYGCLKVLRGGAGPLHGGERRAECDRAPHRRVPAHRGRAGRGQYRHARRLRLPQRPQSTHQPLH